MECENCKYCRWIENKCSTDREDQVWWEPECKLNKCVKEDKNVK